MSKLISNYIKKLPAQERDGFAVRCHTTLGYLRKMSSTQKPIGPEICVAIEHETGGEVTRKALRPNDWHLIWPELKNIPSHQTDKNATTTSGQG